jgi:hypothetical protein
MAELLLKIYQYITCATISLEKGLILNLKINITKYVC